MAAMALVGVLLRMLALGALVMLAKLSSGDAGAALESVFRRGGA